MSLAIKRGLGRSEKQLPSNIVRASFKSETHSDQQIFHIFDFSQIKTCFNIYERFPIQLVIFQNFCM